MTIAQFVRDVLCALDYAANSELVFGIFAVSSAFVFGGYLGKFVIEILSRWRSDE